MNFIELKTKNSKTIKKRDNNDKKTKIPEIK